jgi:predicted Fe-Mo cluster-binding NifX family protein
MKICITSTGPGLDSEMDPRFGRCQYFIFADPESLELEVIENPNLGASGGAGIQSAQLVANRGVEAVITGQVGPNAYSTLQAGKVRIITGIAGKVRDLLEKYKKGELTSSVQGPTVQAHFGMGKSGGMGRGVGKGGVSSPPPQAGSPVSTPGELEDLKKKSAELKDQLDRITERLAKLETKK